MASPSTKPGIRDLSVQVQKNDTVKAFLPEEEFRRMISLERKRSERTQRPFVLLLIDMGSVAPNEKNGRLLHKILSALQTATRETDAMGWYEKDLTIGVMFTEITLDNNLIFSTILSRISGMLSESLTSEQLSGIKFAFHLFPEEWDPNDPGRKNDPTLYPDLKKRRMTNRIGRSIKRFVDVTGSLLLLALLSPVFAAIALAIKMTSRGPVLFRQQRLGEHGAAFTFLKFRSMHVNNDTSRHREYVRKLIAGKAIKQPTNGTSEGIFKLTNDPRITTVGSFLRRTSLDELPQLINVLRGEMSLVGPRPPLPYEVEAYATWHRRRLLEAKPGITGLWQVQGRSRVGFDEMVRLDLRYARDCSAWLDLKILAQTPKAVVAGEGAC